MGNGEDHQGGAEPRPVVAGVAAICGGLSPDHGPGTFLVDVDALLPAAPTFAIPLAVCTTQELPAVKSKSASPGLGHRGLLGHTPYWLDEGNPRSRCGRTPDSYSDYQDDADQSQ